MAAASVALSSVVQTPSLCNGRDSRASGQEATTSAVSFSSRTVYTSLSSLLPSVFQAKNFSGYSKSRAKYARNVVKAAASSARSDEEIREFCLKQFSARKALKVIAGLHNFDRKSVADVVIAAEKGGATHVDIACDADLVRLAASLTSLPVEIGNYDGFYKSGRVFSAEEVLDLTRRTRSLLPKVVLSVTVPHTLPLDEQVSLAEKLETAGADLIQTEGGTSSAPSAPGVHGLIEKAAPTLAAAWSISRAVKVPVICASGLSDVTSPMAITAGAAGVGIGSAVNKLNDQLAMIAAVRSIADSLGLPARSNTLLSSMVAH
ncbi:hypothetical protein AXG93_1847s1180 [Marchantia polymorpha subsp. ruderalis]|uniref:Uncharacterized protein ycf23 n=1 Tax=Marchantia polymorpha subsp. ruderalis TaxID=1480154 RepID=A0A176VGD9_MARPO|nr:hypothetical protein AXG93_1847s1180 [Marchantia polymorpha subsp. ruderalis]